MNTNKLKSLRVLDGFTQEKLAKKADISTKTYNRKELGIVPFTNMEVLKLSKILRLDLNTVNEIFFDNLLTNSICNNKDS